MTKSMFARMASVAVSAALAIPAALAVAPSADASIIPSCDSLEKSMTDIGLSGIGVSVSPYGSSGGGGSYAYLAYFALAWGQDCNFLKGSKNPYHVADPTPGATGIGEPFALQSKPYSDECRGVIAKAGRYYTSSNDLYLVSQENPSGCSGQDRRAPENNFAFVATGLKSEGRYLYEMEIVKGEGEGKCVGVGYRPADAPPNNPPEATIVDCSDRNAALFGPESYDGGDIFHTYRESEDKSLTSKGYLQAPLRYVGHKGYFSIGRWIGGADEATEIFHFRPPGQLT